MRCSTCRSYIPEGLSDPLQCPQCGREAAAQTPAPAASNALAPPPLPETIDTDKPSVDLAPGANTTVLPPPGFAPYFTLRMPLAFGPAAAATTLRQSAPGSLSFGADGFGIVFDGGRHWEKVLYRDVSSMRVHEDSLQITVRDVESRLTLFHPWLPPWIAGPRRKRAAILMELLTRVRSGLTPYEIELYRRRLE